MNNMFVTVRLIVFTYVYKSNALLLNSIISVKFSLLRDFSLNVLAFIFRRSYNYSNFLKRLKWNNLTWHGWQREMIFLSFERKLIPLRIRNINFRFFQTLIEFNALRFIKSLEILPQMICLCYKLPVHYVLFVMICLFVQNTNSRL